MTNPDKLGAAAAPVAMIRDRSDSNGSTRAAFYTGEIPERAPTTLSPTRHHHHHHARKRDRKKKPRAMHDIADVAFTALEEGSNEAMSAGSTRTGGFEQQHQHEVQFTTSDTVLSANTSLSSRATRGSQTLSSKNSHIGGYGSIPETNAPYRSLETIRDDSDACIMDESDWPGSYRYAVSQSTSNEESLHGNARQLSEASLIGTNWLTASTRSDVQRGGDSLRYSANSLSSVYWLAGGSNHNSERGPITETNEHTGFSSIARGTFGPTGSGPALYTPKTQPDTDTSDEDSADEYTSSENEFSYGSLEGASCLDQFEILFSAWLSHGVRVDDITGKHYFVDKYSPADMVRTLLYNPIAPEFTSLQQFNWAVIIGAFMGIYTAFWKWVIETGLEFVWKTIPEWLLEAGVFTDENGSFPLYHYMWITPAIFAGILSYIFVVLPIPIPDQNSWIDSVHCRGVQDYRTFFTLFVLATFGMLSGLSLGPELPLVLTAGMIGSKLGIICKQSMLQARVFNLTAASAAVGGFFGFPMAGALFVLEIPHRMGLQYFEALSPATISSIIAVLINRLVVGNDVTGYYSYPFLSQNLPSGVFVSAVLYGLFGAFIGIFYAKAVIFGKTMVHDWFHAPSSHEENSEMHRDESNVDLPENAPLLQGPKGGPPLKGPSVSRALNLKKRISGFFCFVIPQEKYRAAAAGALAGMAVGVIGMFVPVSHFWGEAQLQHLIDKGRTPLPVFGAPDEPTGTLTALGYCMIDPDDPEAVQEGFSPSCAALIIVSKVAVIGLSLGTGIIGGHFWGPLFVGCAASHLFTHLVNEFANLTGFGHSLAAYPCVVILCTMGSAHVVTFRAHMAIMLILTLTISAFNPDGETSIDSHKVAGDYSAVFPLLVVSVFVSLMVSRGTVFYKMQRERGDIMAVPEVLCEPGLEGRPVVVGFESDENVMDIDSDESRSRPSVSSVEIPSNDVRFVNGGTTQLEIDEAFNAATKASAADARDRFAVHSPAPTIPSHQVSPSTELPPIGQVQTDIISEEGGNTLDGLDELLKRTAGSESSTPRTGTAAVPRPSTARRHRRTQSAPVVPDTIDDSRSQSSRGRTPTRELPRFTPGNRERSNSGSSRSTLVRINSFGELHKHQPSLIEQARLRAASGAADSRHRRVPSLPSGRHSRKSSDSSFFSAAAMATEASGALSMEEIEESFQTLIKSQYNPMSKGSPWTDTI